MPGRVVVQWDKDDCADMGIVKVDLLGLGMMAVLQDAIALVNGERADQDRGGGRRVEIGNPAIRESRASEPRSGVDLAHLPPNDPAVYRCCRRPTRSACSRSSRARRWRRCRGCKPRALLRPRREVAIIRPGPDRRADGASVSEPARRARAGDVSASLARADPGAHARRAAVPGAAAADGDGRGRLHRRPGRGAAARDGLQALREADEADRGAAARRAWRGRASPATRPKQIITSITSFALYGFPESHAASFALLAYASAYLKAHYPAAFYTALLNNQPMGFYHPATLVKDAQRRGVRFPPIDVQVSDWDCRVEPDGASGSG